MLVSFEGWRILELVRELWVCLGGNIGVSSATCG